MLKESAVVMSYDVETGLAKVKCQSQSACGACSAREACGTASLSELNGKRGEHIFTLETITPLRTCLLYTSPSPRDMRRSRMPSSA